ncbi:Homeotic protein caudal [Armadillidium vulgare]|nr:Homeotic protein caudal [Armadillidium vulgare]
MVEENFAISDKSVEQEPTMKQVINQTNLLAATPLLRKKKKRTCFTSNEKTELEKEFLTSKFIYKSRLQELSAQLNIDEKRISIWFRNRRAKAKRESVKANLENIPCLGQLQPPTTNPSNRNNHSTLKPIAEFIGSERSVNSPLDNTSNQLKDITGDYIRFLEESVTTLGTCTPSSTSSEEQFFNNVTNNSQNENFSAYQNNSEISNAYATHMQYMINNQEHLITQQYNTYQEQNHQQYQHQNHPQNHQQYNQQYNQNYYQVYRHQYHQNQQNHQQNYQQNFQYPVQSLNSFQRNLPTENYHYSASEKSSKEIPNNSNVTKQ